jgi:hypothetical protein
VRRTFTQLGVYAASPLAFLILFGYGALWYALRPESFKWHAGATMATWFMTLVIQRVEHRESTPSSTRCFMRWARRATS